MFLNHLLYGVRLVSSIDYSSFDVDITYMRVREKDMGGKESHSRLRAIKSQPLRRVRATLNPSLCTIFLPMPRLERNSRFMQKLLASCHTTRPSDTFVTVDRRISPKPAFQQIVAKVIFSTGIG